MIERVTTKDGSNDKGAWTIYGIFIGGERYSTFSDSIGEAAQMLEGQRAELEWAQDGQYKTALGVTPADQPAGQGDVEPF